MPEPNVSIFDKKIFNGEVFKGYIDRLPNPRLTKLIESKAIRLRPDLAQAMADQDGGNYITTTLKGLIANTVPQNYDGQTDMIPSSTCTYKHSRVVVGRMGSWVENDFSYDITGGEDFLENVAQQINEYWSGVCRCCALGAAGRELDTRKPRSCGALRLSAVLRDRPRMPGRIQRIYLSTPLLFLGSNL